MKFTAWQGGHRKRIYINGLASVHSGKNNDEDPYIKGLSDAHNDLLFDFVIADTIPASETVSFKKIKELKLQIQDALLEILERANQEGVNFETYEDIFEHIKSLNEAAKKEARKGSYKRRELPFKTKTGRSRQNYQKGA